MVFLWLPLESVELEMKKDIKSMSLEEIEKDFSELYAPKYKAKQVYSWLGKGIFSFDEMSDQSKKFREQLNQRYHISGIEIRAKQKSKDGSTVKYLFRLDDGEHIEAVVMRYRNWRTICISTQVGCKMGCGFCATAKGGFSRDLSAAEMLLQVQKACEDLNIRISNIVLMGMGEPLDNYRNVLRFLELASSESGLNIGMRHMTISTCGLCDKIYKLAEDNKQVTLCVSLHAPNDNIRNRIMPINKKYPIDELMRACRYYTEKTGRRISFEYAMINDVNDSEEQAKELALLLKGMLCHVNLIPINEVGGTAYSKSGQGRINTFKNILDRNGINTTVRRTLGDNIDAACGQLKGKHT